MSINLQQLTDAGRSMLGRANNGELLTISRVVIGAGRAGALDELWPLTELLDYKMDSVITQRVDQGNGTLLIDTGFNSSTAPEAFDLAEVGVMARIDNEPERLYCASNVLATGADHVDPQVESIHAFKVKIVIERAANITVIIGDSTDILAENIGAETVGPGWFAEKIANTLRFKRAIEGEGIEIVGEAETVTIRTKAIRIPLDLYVPVSHPDAPGPEVAFSSIPAALAFLAQYRLEADARIHVYDGVYNLTAPIVLNHPDGLHISIIGRIGPNISYASSQLVFETPAWRTHLTAPAGSWDGINIGDLVFIRPISGIAGMCGSGIQRVTGVTPTVLSTNPGLTGAYSPPAGATGSGLVNRMNTILQVPLNTTCFSVQHNFGVLQNLAILGQPDSTASHDGITIGGFNRIVLFFVGIRDFRGATSIGVNVGHGAYLFGDTLSTNNDTYGVYSNGDINITSLYSSNNLFSGLLERASHATLINAYLTGNCQVAGGASAGQISLTDALLDMVNLHSNWSQGIGMTMDQGAQANITNNSTGAFIGNTGPTAQFNNTSVALGVLCSFIQYSGSTFSRDIVRVLFGWAPLTLPMTAVGPDGQIVKLHGAAQDEPDHLPELERPGQQPM